MIEFAEVYVGYPDGQQNVGQPPDAVLLNGFIPETAGAPWATASRTMAQLALPESVPPHQPRSRQRRRW